MGKWLQLLLRSQASSGHGGRCPSGLRPGASVQTGAIPEPRGPRSLPGGLSSHRAPVPDRAGVPQPRSPPIAGTEPSPGPRRHRQLPPRGPRRAARPRQRCQPASTSSINSLHTVHIDRLCSLPAPPFLGRPPPRRLLHRWAARAACCMIHTNSLTQGNQWARKSTRSKARSLSGDRPPSKETQGAASCSPPAPGGPRRHPRGPPAVAPSGRRGSGSAGVQRTGAALRDFSPFPNKTGGSGRWRGDARRQDACIPLPNVRGARPLLPFAAVPSLRLSLPAG